MDKSHLASKSITDLVNGDLSATTPLVVSFFCRNNEPTAETAPRSMGGLQTPLIYLNALVFAMMNTISCILVGLCE